MSNIDYTRLPLHMQEAARGYIEHGQPCGAFLRGVLTNDFRWMMACGDDDNLGALKEWAGWLAWIPLAAWGDATHVDAWIENGGQNKPDLAGQTEGEAK